MGRMECWHFKDGSLSPHLSHRSQQVYELKPFQLTQQGRSYYPAWGLLFVITVVWMAHLDAYVCSLWFYWPLKCFFIIYGAICFIFVMWFGNSLDKALLDNWHDLVCLFSSEANGAVGLKPGEHFNYNHSITTLCFKVKEVDHRQGSEGKHIPTITWNDPLTCYF